MHGTHIIGNAKRTSKLVVMVFAVAGMGSAAAISSPVVQTSNPRWMLATGTTQLTIGVDSSDHLVVYRLSDPVTNWNWTPVSSIFPLVAAATVNNNRINLQWKYQDAIVDNSAGTRVTLRFTDAIDSLELTSEWWARPGSGPVRHAMLIRNTGGRSITIPYQAGMDVGVVGPNTPAEPFRWWSFADDASWQYDGTGVYTNAITNTSSRSIIFTTGQDFIPLAILEVGNTRGIYVGVEWSNGVLSVNGSAVGAAIGARVQTGTPTNFIWDLAPGKTFVVPPVFIGAYNGDIDDAGNNLRKYLFNYSMPQILRTDTTFPKMQWNGCYALANSPGSWTPVQSKFNPWIDDISALGFEEAVVDIGWWRGTEPDYNTSTWPNGMAASADYAHSKGMQFVLYWTDNADMTTSKGQTERANRVKRLYNEHRVDVYRSDCTSGSVAGASYADALGLYAMLDSLNSQVKGFQWENCNCGGPIKDYGAMKRTVKVQSNDSYSAHDQQICFFDCSFALHPIQILSPMGKDNHTSKDARGAHYDCRSGMLGAPQLWWDAPRGLNGDPMTDAMKSAVAADVALYKKSIRPLQRNGNFYHLTMDRPTGATWFAVEYYDPDAAKGVAYIFRQYSQDSVRTIKFKGLNPQTTYAVTFNDGTNATIAKSGSDLMSTGTAIKLGTPALSELVFISGSSQTPIRKNGGRMQYHPSLLQGTFNHNGDIRLRFVAPGSNGTMSRVVIGLFDMRGRMVQQVTNGTFAAGEQTIAVRNSTRDNSLAAQACVLRMSVNGSQFYMKTIPSFNEVSWASKEDGYAKPESERM